MCLQRQKWREIVQLASLLNPKVSTPLMSLTSTVTDTQLFSPNYNSNIDKYIAPYNNSNNNLSVWSRLSEV